jgi:hypothetical protein
LIDAARSYVVQMLPRLPNFFATRTTDRFDDSPQMPAKGGWPVRAGLHQVGTLSRQITYRDGKEIQDPLGETAANGSSAGAQGAQPEQGLHTWGEFGPELSVILADTANGKVTFSHWEQTSAGLVAVYRYSVPRAASHYTVNYCCYRPPDSTQQDPIVDLSRSRNQQAVMASPAVAPPRPFSDKPGYQGTLSIDPATGAILRIALEADLKTGDPLSRVATVVEYGPVKIGDRTFICPVRSLAISRENPTRNGHPNDSPTLLVNETSFTNYHRLGTTVKILSSATEHESPETADTNPGAQVKIDIAAGALGIEQQDGRRMDTLDIFFIQRDSTCRMGYEGTEANFQTGTAWPQRHRNSLTRSSRHCDNVNPQSARTAPLARLPATASHSHSMVPGGFDVMS